MVEDGLKCFGKFSLYKPGARHCVALHGLPATREQYWPHCFLARLSPFSFDPTVCLLPFFDTVIAIIIHLCMSLCRCLCVAMCLSHLRNNVNVCWHRKLSSSSASGEDSSVGEVSAICERDYTFFMQTVCWAPYFSMSPKHFTMATMALFSASEQIHSTVVICDPDWVSPALQSALWISTISETYFVYNWIFHYYSTNMPSMQLNLTLLFTQSIDRIPEEEGSCAHSTRQFPIIPTSPCIPAEASGNHCATGKHNSVNSQCFRLCFFWELNCYKRYCGTKWLCST